jgi:hypothetical protein
MANIRDYYRKNYLYEGHRLMLPELRDRVVHTCSECKFLIRIVGRDEVRPGCAALIPQYAGLARRVPGELNVVDVLKEVGSDGLKLVTDGIAPHRQACGQFHPRV